MFPCRFLNAAVAFALPFLVSADYFTNPPSFVGNMVETQDLSTSFTIGQTVQLTWYLTNLSEQYISLKLVRWDVQPGVAIQSFITNKQNTGFYTWTIGNGDNIDQSALSISPNFALQISDPTGQLVSTGNPPGFINSTLTSRGFVINANNITVSCTASSTATSTSISTSTSTQTPSSSCPGLTTGDKTGIGVGVGVGVPLVFAILLNTFLRRRHTRQQNAPIREESKLTDHPRDPVVAGWTGPTQHTASMERNEFSELPTLQPPMELSGEPHGQYSPRRY